MVVLDTDHVSLLDHAPSDESRRLLEKLDAASLDGVVTTIITFEEQTRGWLSVIARARRPETLVTAYGRLSRHLANYRDIAVLGFDAACARVLDGLLAQRIRIGTMDLRIAAIVLSHDATLLTRNRQDFGKVPGLRIEDWTA